MINYQVKLEKSLTEGLKTSAFLKPNRENAVVLDAIDIIRIIIPSGTKSLQNVFLVSHRGLQIKRPIANNLLPVPALINH